ncbi:gas vesicle protein [Streptomyces indicus]|uniref:Gas vesicle synthesis protein GvpO n=1 Tax=Streptomyces indicus TaxID=417292 RepID=A0A1G8UJ52_9ACTN|nr:gas vesicle protein [Streptomyces indicus]SDJ53808.1 Gas vesicle synthesis protein GvpO [Streptomyces indicus]
MTETSKTRKDTRSANNSSGNGARQNERQNARQEKESEPEAQQDREQAAAPMEVLREARLQLAELTGMQAESVSAFERTQDGWHLEIEVLELTRVPDTMSLLATYAVDLDPQGMLTGYRRVRRYERGRADAQRPGGR